MDLQELNNFIKLIVDKSFEANKYINDMQPWSLKKTDKKRMNTVLYVALESIRKISILLYPIIPSSSEKIFQALNLSKDKINLKSLKNHNVIKPGTKLNKLDILFKKH